jgi:phosphoenolpyruvate carboxykinase (GTP)
VWWEDLTDEPPAHLTDWKGQTWTPASDAPAAHPNSRFCSPASQVPSIAPEWEDPKGVPISAFLFGGRRATTVPLVFESRSWQHGVLVAATMGSEKTAAATGGLGELRRDPFAMLPFCGYNMGDYFGHWLDVGVSAVADKLPKLFWVNWFRKDGNGRFLWPGFGDNSRVLKWALERIAGTAEATETAIGWVPTPDSLDTEGLDIDADALTELLRVDDDALKAQLPQVKEHLARFGDQLPAAVKAQLEDLEQRLAA